MLLFKKYSLLTALALVFLNSINAQEIRVNASFSRSAIIIGDTVQYTIDVYKPAEMQVRFAAFADFFPENIEVKSQFAPDSVKLPDGTWKLSQSFLLMAFDSAYIEITNAKVLVNNGGRIDSIHAPMAYLNVNNPKIENELKPNAAIEETPFTFKEFINEYYPYIIAFVVLVIIALASWYFYRKYKQKQAEKPIYIPDEPAHVIALRELEKLKEQKLWQQGKVKEYYTELTDIIRTYIWYRFAVPAQERTSEEILDSLKSVAAIDKQHWNDLRNLLTDSDLVKFAKFNPAPDVNDKVFTDAVQFVVNTKKVAVVQTINETSTNEPI